MNIGRRGDGAVAPGESAHDQPMAVAVLGAGYVGLVTGACLAKLGHRVTVTENDRERLAALQRGTVPFNEPIWTSLSNEVAASVACESPGIRPTLCRMPMRSSSVSG